MDGPSLDERLGRLVKSRENAKVLMAEPPARWENECEGIFKDFRLACVHLRREPAILNSVEDKEACWRFICKFTRERPFWHERCIEVLKILMLSDDWVRAFVDEPEAHIKDLPPAIADEFAKRADEVVPSRPKEDGELDRAKELAKAATPGTPITAGPDPYATPAGMSIVVQRCTKARILLDEEKDSWGEIGSGLLVSVSFAQGATEERVCSAARFLLTAKLSTAEKWERGSQAKRPAFASDAESVAALCKRGVDQGILVIPQASLSGGIAEEDMGLKYESRCKRDDASALYNTFVDALKKVVQELGSSQAINPWLTPSITSSLQKSRSVEKGKTPSIVAGDFGSRQVMEFASAGPFMHSFHF